MKKKPYIIANWKMAKSFSQALQWTETYKAELEKLTELSTLIICPDFCSLWPIKQTLPASVFLGAQNCSSHKIGPYTGQVSAQSLSDVQCNYCIIGHAEQRAIGDNDKQIAQKTAHLLEVGITPIICIGENQEQRQAQKTNIVLEEQLKPIFEQIKNYSEKTMLIAYEPIWSIGSDQVPTPDELQNTIDQIKKLFTIQAQKNVIIIYGGSVNPQIAQEYSQKTSIDGFLLGRTSLDFQMLKKIVLSIT